VSKKNWTLFHLSITLAKSVRFLSRVSILTRGIDIANLSVRLSVCLSVRYVRVSDENGWGIKISQFFLPISRYISQMLQDIAIVTMEGE